MAAVHEHTIHLPVTPSRVQLATNGTYVALPHSKGLVRVWSQQDLTCKPLELEGHKKLVSGLAFGHCCGPTLLCSAAEDYVIVWNIEKARNCLDTGQQIRGTVIGKTLGYIQYVAFNLEDTLVAVCASNDVYILDSKTDRVDSILEGHTSLVNVAEFCPHYTSTLVTASDDRTFKIWNIANGSMVYQSTIISSSPFISLAMNPVEQNFALGTSDGQVRVYDLTDGNGFRCLHHLDVHKLAKQIQEAREVVAASLSPGSKDKAGPVRISSLPAWQRNDTTPNDQDPEPSCDETEVGCSILALLYSEQCADQERTDSPAEVPAFLRQNDKLVNHLLDSTNPTLVIGTTGSLIQFNSKSYEPMQFTNINEPMVSNSNTANRRETISFAGSMTLSAGARLDKTSVLVGSMFNRDVHVLRMFHPTQADASVLHSQLAQAKKLTKVTGSHGNDLEAGGGAAACLVDEITTALSVLSCEPLASNSPLKSELTMKPKDDKSPAKPASVRGPVTKLGSLDKKGKIVDKQPIVFHEKVKSSGYSKETPKRTMFQPKTNVPHTQKSSNKPTKSTSSTKSIIKEYPMTSDPPTQMVKKIDVAERPTAINSVKFSDDGQNVACALANTSAQVFKMPLTGKGCVCAGHSGIVTSCYWSHDNTRLVTSSDDKSASIWSPGIPDPIMTMTLANNNFGADKEGGLKPTKDNPSFSKAVKFAQFYYVDRFILLTSGSSISLYKYHLDTSKSDLKRYLSQNRYKLVKSLQMTEAQQISAFSAVNSFHSYLAFCAGTNKAIEVFDLNVWRSVRVIPEAHTKAPHTICQNQGSAYVSHASSAYDLFLTAAAGDCIKLWDLRSNRCVRRYEGHSNRAHPCGLAISPCSRFFATGSEDRSAYVFDIRSGTYLHKLTGHTDTVSDVAFHPLYPQLLTATLDGKLRLFVDK